MTRTYAYQPEILGYLESVADDFDLRRHLMLNTQVRSMRWNSDRSHWDVELANGDTVVADIVVSAVGLFGAVRYPGYRGSGRIRWHADAHRAMGSDRRPHR